MTLETRLYRWWWRTKLGRALSSELAQAHTDLLGAIHGYETARNDAETHHRNLLCAYELIEARDQQYATLAARCRAAEDARDILEQELQAMTDGIRWFEGSDK